MALTWVVTADSSSANIFEIQGIGGEFQPVAQLRHTESQLRDSELVSDRQGRISDSVNTGGRHAMIPHSDPKDHEIDVFAREVCQFIDNARSRNQFERLVFVAPPEFLGRLRNTISAASNKLVTESLAKNLMGCDEDTIRSRLKTLI